jgi:hypothetical protein
VTAGHFFYIPSILLLGIVIGWVLASRAAADAYAAQLRRANPKAHPSTAARGALSNVEGQSPNPKARVPRPKASTEGDA